MKPNVVRLSDDNFKRLSGMAHPGQSIDGVLTELFAKLDNQPVLPKAHEPPKPTETPYTPPVDTKPVDPMFDDKEEG